MFTKQLCPWTNYQYYRFNQQYSQQGIPDMQMSISNHHMAPHAIPRCQYDIELKPLADDRRIIVQDWTFSLSKSNTTTSWSCKLNTATAKLYKLNTTTSQSTHFLILKIPWPILTWVLDYLHIFDGSSPPKLTKNILINNIIKLSSTVLSLTLRTWIFHSANIIFWV